MLIIYYLQQCYEKDIWIGHFLKQSYYLIWHKLIDIYIYVSVKYESEAGTNQLKSWLVLLTFTLP